MAEGTTAMAPEVLELSRRLEAALSASGPEEARAAARAFGEEAQAQMTVEKRVPAIASELVRCMTRHEAAKRVADVVGWDLVSCLAPHVADCHEALQAVDVLVGLCPAREAHLMLMEALSTPGRLTTPAAHAITATCMPRVLLRLPPDKRGPFLPQPFQAALSRALDDTDPEVPPDGEQQRPTDEEEEQANGTEQPGKRVRKRPESRGVSAAMDFAAAILDQTPPPLPPEQPPPPQGGSRGVPTAAEVGHVVGLLLRLLGRCLTPSHPPPTSPSHPLPPQLTRLLALLSKALQLPPPPSSTDPPLILETLLLQPRRESQGSLPPQESVVSGGPLAWESSDVSLAAYYLVILGHGPPLPSPMSPAYAASLIAEPAARLLKSPMLSLQGLTAAHTILRLVPPPLGPWRLDGPIHIKQAPPPPGHNHQAAGVGEECAWVVVLRSLTGCMVFLSEDEGRQSAYRALQGTFAILSDHSRFRALQCLLSRPGYSRTTTALLISFAQKAAAAAWTSSCTQPSPFKTHKVRGLYEEVLWTACGKSADALAAMASAEQEGAGELDCLMSALNLHRFLLLKDGKGEGSLTGVWDEACVAEATAKLQSLQTKLRQAGAGGQQQAGGSTSSKSFRLGMVDEVVSLRLLPLLLGEAMDEEPLPPPPPIAATAAATPPATA